jgi:uncharacterized protein (TIGR03118 family)
LAFLPVLKSIGISNWHGRCTLILATCSFAGWLMSIEDRRFDMAQQQDKCKRSTSRLLAPAAIAVALFAVSGPARSDPFVSVTNLVTDDQGVNAAQITDPNLKNAWGLAGSGTGPFWIGDNGSGLSTVYSVNPLTDATSKLGLTVAIPGDGSVTGVAFNGAGAGAFGGDNFLFVSEDGTVSGWRGALGSNAEILQTAAPDNVYKGAAFATVGGHGYLYAANFHAGTIDILKGDTLAPNLTGSFTDPALPAGFAPFDIKLLNGALYVTYAKPDATGHDDVPGLGNGFVDRFDLQGNLLGRVASQGTLNSPWGLAVAPSSFGAVAGDLLVGNFGDGRINVYDIGDNFIGQLLTALGDPLSIDGLWALSTGGGGNEGSRDEIYFTAGPDDESHGLFGAIAPVPEPATLSLLAAGLGLAFAFRRKRG